MFKKLSNFQKENKNYFHFHSKNEVLFQNELRPKSKLIVKKMNKRLKMKTCLKI